VSQALAVAEDREIIEAMLWLKVSAACRAVGMPLDADAPDFICAASAAPPVSVFRLAGDPSELMGAEKCPDDGVFDQPGAGDVGAPKEKGK
jgi:hypothetical protein